MSSAPTITFINEDHKEPVTIVIAEHAGAATPVRMTVGHGGSVSHEVTDGNGPWEVAVHLHDKDSKGRGSVTATSTVFGLPAELKLETDDGTVRYHFRGDPSNHRPRPDQPDRNASVLDRGSSWTPVGELPIGDLGDDLKFSIQQQSQTQWCWAAVTASVAKFYGEDKYTQCKLANWAFGTPSCNCCSKQVPSACNNPWSTMAALSYVGNLADGTGGSISFDAMKQQIDHGDPVALHIKWKDGFRHAVVISGYNGSQITVQDPGGATTTLIDYDKFPKEYMGGASWDATFTTKPH